MKIHDVLALLACIVAILAVAGAGCTGTADQTGGAMNVPKSPSISGACRRQIRHP